tara:strand:- start:578 stop:1297 length:720 start_codon:yes stop_codon:yes gene_type:complete
VGLMGTSNSTLMNTMQTNQQAQFKSINNLLTLQENHVEDFFQYHGEAFLNAIAQLMTDTMEKVLGQMLPNLEFETNSNGKMNISGDCLSHFNAVTEANINLDLQTLLASAINSEVVMQRRMAKTQYLESQGFSTPQEQMQQMVNPATGMNSNGMNSNGMNPQNIQGNNMAVGMNNTMNQQQMAFNNQSGYPIPPAGYDNMNNPYWIDPQTGQMSYTPPASGLGLATAVSKGIAWAKWLA